MKAQKVFNPETDTIALTDHRGYWTIVVPEKVLMASAQLATPRLTAIHDVRIQDIHGIPYLFFRGKDQEKPEFGYTIMVMLVKTAEGVWKTGSIFQGCWGNICTTCGFDEYWGCACERYDGVPDESSVSFCNHMITMGMGLKKVAIPD